MAQENSVVSSFKFNAQAPEFVPSPRAVSQTQSPHSPFSGYFYSPSYQYADSAADWFYMGDPESMQMMYNPSWEAIDPNNILPDDLRINIVKQVEYMLYMLSDMSSHSSEAKYLNKDPEGYVSIAAIASTTKIKSLITNHQVLSQALQSSSKLVVSLDGTKVKCKYSSADKEKEALMARTVVVENLPEDHSLDSIEKIFRVVGKTSSIKLCPPSEPNSPRVKGEIVLSNKLHALIEFETARVAEKAVEKLNDERNWRTGLRVRTLLKCSPNSVLKGKKTDFDWILSDDEKSNDSGDEYYGGDFGSEHSGDDNSPRMKRVFGRGRGKGRLRSTNRSLYSTPSSSPILCDLLSRQCMKGPRMPDGTKGFTIGRGKPIATTA